jgi:gamma-tubulin complex component 3
LNGNTAHASLVRNILIKASRPWFEILFLWTTQGILSDPWNELFISESPDADDRYLWSDKYIINRSQVPNGILDKELVGPAFNVGKGINFIRRCLQDGQWTMPRLTDESLPVGRDTVHRPFDLDRGTSRHEEDKTKVLGYGYTPKEDMNGDNIALKSTLNRSSRLVHSYILRTLKDENHLMLHLYAMKQFLLLGQGDFFSTLMEGLDEEFGQQAAVNTLYSRGIASINKHSLIAIVDGALRSTNAKQLPPFVIERLQVELMLGPDDVQNGPSWDWNSVQEQIRDNDQPPDERTVYDIFLMDYQVPDPMIAIVPEPSLHMYQRIFKLLFRLKRIEYLLNSTWRQSASLQHSLQLSAQHTGIDVSQSQGYKQASFLLRNISILRQSMMHLVVNLKSFLHFEVIEGGWFRLVAAIDDATTLDEIIEAHNNYINDIARKAMVQGSGHGDPIQQKLVEQVESALVVTTEFCLLQHAVFADALDAADTAAEGRKQAASRIRDGEWGFKSEKEMEEQQRLFGLADPILMEEVDRMTIEFQDGALGLIQALNDKVNGSTAVLFEEDDTGCSRRTQRIGEEEETGPQRFLIAQLDNNNYYTQHARR